MDSDVDAFIVRIWQEAENAEKDQALWRGSILHVGNNEQLYFYDMDSIAHFIQEQIQDRQQNLAHGLQRVRRQPWFQTKPGFFAWLNHRLTKMKQMLWHTQE